MKITEDVLQVLSNAVVIGNTLKLVGQLDRTLYTRTDKVLKAAGGVWKRGQSPPYTNPNQRWLAVSKANPSTAATKNRPMNGRFWDAKVVVLGFTKNIHPNLLTIYYFTFLVK